MYLFIKDIVDLRFQRCGEGIRNTFSWNVPLFWETAYLYGDDVVSKIVLDATWRCTSSVSQKLHWRRHWLLLMIVHGVNQYMKVNYWWMNLNKQEQEISTC